MEEIDPKLCAEKAKAYFLQGYGCCQSVCLTFAEHYRVDREVLLSVTSSFGGGMGRMREVCGTVSGMAILNGLHVPCTDLSKKEQKTNNYIRMQELAKRFKERNGSYICRELLNLPKGEGSSPIPSERTQEYYKRRPCADYCATAAEIYAEILKEEK